MKKLSLRQVKRLKFESVEKLKAGILKVCDRTRTRPHTPY